MSIRFLAIVSLIFLQGCSSLCFVSKKNGTSNISVLDMGFTYTRSDERAALYDEISKQCDQISNYSNDVGTAIPAVNSTIKLMRINSTSSCLLKKSKNDAIEKNGNLVVHGNRWHFEGGGSSYSSTYICEEEFIEKVKAYNKLKNENASKTDTDAT